MRLALFTNGYLSVLAEESDIHKTLMLQHLQELVEDSEVYGWSVVRDYHAAWIQQIEQGQAVLGDEHKKIKMRRLLVYMWYMPAPGAEQPSDTPAPIQQPY